MDIAEKRLPQDGAIALRTGARRVDMRVNTCPTVFGEKVVLRVLDKEALPLQLARLGMDQRQEEDLRAAIEMPHGLRPARRAAARVPRCTPA
jgi:type IV pilus assembly protein PilB